ncbi:MAG: PilZ domain-containing protein [Candidatus Omnitrophota bacterium]
MSTWMGGKERRRFPRAGAKFILKYRVYGPPEMMSMVGVDSKGAIMTDLCEAGTAFVTEYNLVVGTTVEINFTLISPDPVAGSRHEKIIVRGEVKNSAMIGRSEYRIGVEFPHVDDEKKSIIRFFVEGRD